MRVPVNDDVPDAPGLPQVEEEADESLYWLEILVETGLMAEARLKDLIREADELTAIFTSTSHTARQNRDRQ